MAVADAGTADAPRAVRPAPWSRCPRRPRPGPAPVTPSPVAARRCRSAERATTRAITGTTSWEVASRDRSAMSGVSPELSPPTSSPRARTHSAPGSTGPPPGEHDLGDRGHPDQREPGGEQVDPERAGAPRPAAAEHDGLRPGRQPRVGERALRRQRHVGLRPGPAQGRSCGMLPGGSAHASGLTSSVARSLIRKAHDVRPAAYAAAGQDQPPGCRPDGGRFLESSTSATTRRDL